MLEPDKIKLPVGRILKTHGVKGELNVELFDCAEPDSDFAPEACLIVEIDGLDVPFFVASSRMRGTASLLLTLDDLDSETDASALVGQTLYVYADPDDVNEDMTAGQLVGYEIIDAQANASVGKVADIIELTPDNWYFSIQGSGQLIPVVDEMILSVDSETQIIMMDLPEGLLEL